MQTNNLQQHSILPATLTKADMVSLIRLVHGRYTPTDSTQAKRKKVASRTKQTAREPVPPVVKCFRLLDLCAELRNNIVSTLSISHAVAIADFWCDISTRKCAKTPQLTSLLEAKAISLEVLVFAASTNKFGMSFSQCCTCTVLLLRSRPTISITDTSSPS